MMGPSLQPFHLAVMDWDLVGGKPARYQMLDQKNMDSQSASQRLPLSLDQALVLNSDLHDGATFPVAADAASLLLLLVLLSWQITVAFLVLTF